MSRTPVTRSGLRQYDSLPPLDAVLAAWANQGANPTWHQVMQSEVRDSMPLLARALDRLTAEREAGPHSRACGIRKHDHGTDCHANCPTCHGTTR